MLRMRLHIRHRLNTRSLHLRQHTYTSVSQAVSTHARADDRHSILFPLFSLIILGPACSMDDASLELLHTLNIRPFEVVQDTSPVEQNMAPIFEQPGRTVRVRLFQLDEPLPSLLLPVAPNDFGVEGHVFPQPPHFAYFVQVFPDIRRIGEETRPVRLWNRM